LRLALTAGEKIRGETSKPASPLMVIVITLVLQQALLVLPVPLVLLVLLVQPVQQALPVLPVLLALLALLALPVFLVLPGFLVLPVQAAAPSSGNRWSELRKQPLLRQAKRPKISS